MRCYSLTKHCLLQPMLSYRGRGGTNEIVDQKEEKGGGVPRVGLFGVGQTVIHLEGSKEGGIVDRMLGCR